MREQLHLLILIISCDYIGSTMLAVLHCGHVLWKLSGLIARLSTSFYYYVDAYNQLQMKQ